MTRTSHATFAAAALAALALSADAHAAIFRAYLSSEGSDANACTLAAPCRLLPAALAAVADGGEIWLLDSANFNTAPVNVAKSVSILAIPGAVGSVVAIAGDAIAIGTPGVRVALRNLVIAPFPGGGGVNGINMTAGASLTLEGCLLANLPQAGIVVAADAGVRIFDTTIRDSGSHGILLQDGARATVVRATLSGNTGDGVRVAAALAGSTTTADVSASTLDGNANGLSATSAHATAIVKVSVRDSRAVRNASAGLSATSTAGAAVTLSASSNIASNNATGIAAQSTGARVWSAGNTVSDNGTGLSNQSAVFESAGSNAVRNNGTQSVGTITPIAPM